MSPRQFFLGPDGRLRYIWRAALYWALVRYLLPPLLEPWIFKFAEIFGIKDTLNAPSLALAEFALLLEALIATLPLALYERRRVDSYGLSVSKALKRETAEGMLIGVAMTGVVAGGMLLFGGMQIQGVATTGVALAWSALAWAGANLIVGLAEEFSYRSYFLQSLWKSIGFWPASALIALLFTADHYFYKPGENIWDVISLVSLSLFTCYTVLRTGTLWFAVGFHAAFDFMQFFVIGTPNGTLLPDGRLLNCTFEGPAWLTGGALGTEASWLMYPAIALGWFYVWWRFKPGSERSDPP